MPAGTNRARRASSRTPAAPYRRQSPTPRAENHADWSYHDAYETAGSDDDFTNGLPFEMLHHRRIRERNLAQPLLRGVGWHGQPRTHLTIDLDGHDDLVRFGDRLIVGRPPGRDDPA